MPIYCYETPEGEIVEKVFLVGMAPAAILVESGLANRSYQAEGVSVPSPSGWPMTCVASGVNAEQAGELRSHLAEKGVPTEVTKDGDPVYTSATHRRKALKVRGFIDKNSFN